MSVETKAEASLDRARQALLDGERSLAALEVAGILSVEPRHPAALHLLALIRADEGNLATAAELLESALAVGPHVLTWLRDRATIHLAMGEHDRAAALFRQTLEGLPDDPETLNGYGKALLLLGESTEAVSVFRRAADIDPEGEALHGLARALLLRGEHGDADTVCRQILARDPSDAEGYRVLGEIGVAVRDREATREAFEQVLRLVPGDENAHVYLTLAYWRLGDLERALTHARHLVESGGATHALHSFYIYLLLYCESETPHSIRAAAESMGRSLNPAWRTEWPRRQAEDPERRLRVGYLSGEFLHGPAFSFFPALIGNHDVEQVEVFCYHTAARSDRQTEWYQRLGNWRDCGAMDSAAIAGQVGRDAIDILVDLSGFFPNNRLEVFAQRAAPIQVTYPNCPVTTGVGNMDYILTDHWISPRGYEDHYTEEAVRLPSGYIVYSPPEEPSLVMPLPALRAGAVTFGLFQQLPKLNSTVCDVVAAVLRAVPTAKLLIKSANLTQDAHGSALQERLTAEFEARGVGRDRLRVLGPCSHYRSMSIMAEADIALDTFPYSGQTTTCECLWMGVPVVTLRSPRHGGRVGTGLMQRLGLGHLAAETPDDYVRVAATLAKDLPALSGLRAGLRERLQRASLLDGKRLGRELDSAYRWMWRRWCSMPQKEMET